MRCAATIRSALCVVAATTSACDGPQSALDTRSPDAAAIAELWWIMLGVTGIPAVLYISFILFGAIHRRARDGARPVPDALPASAGTRPIIAFGAVIPAILVVTVLVTTFQTGSRVSIVAASPALTIDVIAHQFWWEVVYPEHGITTANEIRVPAGERVRLRLTTADVIHSLWVPRLQAKMDMMPDRITELSILADRPGIYRGQCYEFCGAQHALMGFELVAMPPAELDAWLTDQRRPAPPPADPLAARGLEVFEQAECGHCHMIRGVIEPGPRRSPGPDLTHLASRRTIGAALLPNNRGYLSGWILSPQAHKPGNRMPPTTLPPEDLHALLHYLEALR